MIGWLPPGSDPSLIAREHALFNEPEITNRVSEGSFESGASVLWD